MPETFIQTIPLDAPDHEREALMDDLGRFVANLHESGLNPVVGVEATSGGDTFIVTAGHDDEPEAA